MNIEQFWQLIDKTHAASDGDPEKQMQLLIDELVTMPVEAIFDYQRIQDSLEDRAYRSDLWNAAYIIGEGCGDDSFMDFRAWLIAQGQHVFEAALQNPDTLADVVSVDGRYDTQWEGLLYVGAYAYEQKTGTEDGIPLMHERAELADEHLLTEDKEELSQHFPKLWDKFGW